MTESHQSFLQDYYPRRQCASQRTYCTPRIHASVTLLPTSPYLLTSHSPVQPSSMFATTHRAPDQDYPSPAPSIPSPGPHPHHPQIDHYANYSQPSPMISGVSNENSALSFVQTESSIGPTRVRTRRQASLQQGLLGRRPQSTSNMSRHEQGHYDPGAHLHAQSAMAPRSRTPSGGSCSGSNYQPSNLDRLEINMASAVPMQMQSPYHPITPTSLSPYSPYEHRVHSRSTSGSTNFDARPASPALSIASNYTAASSVVHYTSTSKEPAPDKHKKARLTPLDRKAICLHAAQFPNQRQEDVARHFQVERSTISKILKSKERWLAVQDGTEHTAKHRWVTSAFKSMPLLTNSLQAVQVSSDRSENGRLDPGMR
ncbi:hypothetical protein BDQ12DRAFT_460463 [Crucibulum laeve]|uniref:Uncharacterized protein n=1 Tax=Crucibulum laeve TaxID=68775 RepID=A0A5C3M7G2_9AGAR|nr:hypothetical protein BDQ12DRAFT_460463 [Crucibulum laeve]